MTMWATLAKAIQKTGPCALATVVSTQGSTPRGTDAWMIVTANGFHGSIGGGTVEWRVQAEAQAMLQAAHKKRKLDYVLGPDLGQCCGGRMQIEIELFSSADLKNLQNKLVEDQRPNVYIFGAGHVGRALVLALATLPYAVKWFDPRANAFPVVMPSNTTPYQLADVVATLNTAPLYSFVFVMTHSHALDFVIVDAALRQSQNLHIGLIGSATKRARFQKRLREAGLSAARVAELICPIGVPGITSKHPSAIAISVAAQILQLDAEEKCAETLSAQHMHKAS